MTATVVLAGDSGVSVQMSEARKLSAWGVGIILLALLPAIAWMVFAELSSAVVAQAFVKVDLDRRPVQHAEGGLVREVKVRDGQRVAKGETLLVLGDVFVDAEVNRLTYRLMTERASQARLEAEQLGAASITVPPELLLAAVGDIRVSEHLAKEKSLFSARRDAVSGQVLLLREQREKIMQESRFLQAQIAKATESLQFQREELDNSRGLVKEGFIAASKISQMDATVADYGVKLEERRSELSRAEQRLVDTELRMKSIESDYRQQASDQLKATSARVSELQQELRKSTDASTRQAIVAPEAGVVVNLRFTTAGAVISPRETIADVVPENPRLVIEARFRTEDVSNVHEGQVAEIRFAAFNYRTTKLVEGKVFYVAADRVVDRASNAAYFVALIEVDRSSLETAGEGLKLQAGMPAEVFLKGEAHTPLQYLLAPVTQSLQRAGRER